MKITRSFSYIALFICLLSSFSSCQRSRDELVEDGKSASRHVGKGMQTLFGKKGESRQISSSEQFYGPAETEYVPLSDDTLYKQITLGDPEAISQINESTHLPLALEEPGELGSNVPSINNFATPEMMNLSTVFKPIYFDYNNYKIKEGSDLETIRLVADFVNRHKEYYLFVEGHCDERGSAAYNLALGSRRSNSVRNLLVREGGNLNKIFTISYGKERPIDFNHTAAAWRKNRRAEFKLYKKT